MSATACPDRAQLVDYLQGRLAEEAANRLQQHLEHCKTCDGALAELESHAQTFLAGLRALGNAADAEPATDPQLRNALAKLGDLAPRPDFPASSGDGNHSDDYAPPADSSDTIGPAGGSSLRGLDAVPLPNEAVDRDRASNIAVAVDREWGDTGQLEFDGYEILGEIARGGMGVVYKVRDPRLNRLAALKMIATQGHAGPEEVARFRAEAEAIARLQHPHIVQIFDVGQHNGQPYMVLELVEGGNLAQKIAGQLLPPREAARLLMILARAVHVAHSCGVIHRDLKPANILLADSIAARSGKTALSSAAPDGSLAPARLEEFTWVPKITDFGLAKQLDADSAQTRSGAVMGTPSYMAPEQAEGRIHSIGPATDVYALGAILYELFTGRPPFRAATAWETVRQVISDDPVPPTRLQPKLPRELETICLKCLHKEPASRYRSAELLAEDLRRFLHNETILARPTSLVIRSLKWAKRHRAAATGVASLAMILLSLSVATFLLMAANQREREAKQNAVLARATADKQRQRATDAQAAAERKRKEALEYAQFLQSVFLTSDPLGLQGSGFADVQQRGSDVTAREILDRGAAKVKTQFQDDPLARASMLDTMGNVYRSLGAVDEAEAMIAEALALRRQHLTEDHLDVSGSLYSLGWIRLEQGRFDDAEQLFRQAVAVQKKHLGPDDLQVATTLFSLAWSIGNRHGEEVSRKQEVEALFAEVVRIRKLRLGEKHRDVGMALAGLGLAILPRSRPEGILVLNEAFQVLEGTDEASEFFNLYLRARLARQAGRYDSAQPMYEKSLEGARDLLGEQHPLYLMLMGDYAGLLRQKGETERGMQMIRSAINMANRSFMRWHPALIEALTELAHEERKRQNREEAERLYRRALEIALRTGRSTQVEQLNATIEELQRENGRGADPPIP